MVGGVSASYPVRRRRTNLLPPHAPRDRALHASDCGSCYVHAALSVVQDRIKVAKGGRPPDVMLARQSFINCGYASVCMCVCVFVWVVHPTR